MNLTYPGDVRHVAVGRVMGPDLHGGFVVATAAEYDPGTDKTRVAFRPLQPAEREHVVEDTDGAPWLGQIGVAW
ncbi:MAG: hypothetical protein J0I34_07465 [Pseudonocardia sp.]|uniref:hypothetical protein n=1 Tax=Actinomycetes TaxID=1760 RepID=UPI0008685150|nr:MULTISPECIES: hypothetical protein [Actinomycetes]MBN9108606.1 hypothetical protein [Pseudonocardia sp.]ODU27485.1 MAG: hypothetical protein ABS80_03650 [Pseudonocardia sp. SCN 72-51]ODV07753.1 MAG: hypothetical protein ABT15_06670 [Pseudonocardia sp. SCN 73-27]